MITNEMTNADNTAERNDGGHYAAAEDPKGIMEDVRALAVQEWAKAVGS